MLLYGTANPVGYGDEDYEGLYLTDKDINDITPHMIDIPVKIEHVGKPVGKVISAWKHDGRMDLLLDIDETGIEGALLSQFVQQGFCQDLSLGYHVQMSKTPAGNLKAGQKKVVEVSVVKAGARENCHIRGFTAAASASSAGKKGVGRQSYPHKLLY